MARKSTAAARLRKPVGTTVGLGGFHPVFGPVADPGPDIGGWGGWGGGFGGWHGGPVADPGPGFGGWRGSILSAIDLSALEPEAVKQLSEFRVKRINASIRALEEHVAITNAEFALVSRFAQKIQFDRLKIPPYGGGDPVPELRPIEFVRYLHDLRIAPIQRTIDYMKASAKAIEARA